MENIAIPEGLVCERIWAGRAEDKTSREGDAVTVSALLLEFEDNADEKEMDDVFEELVMTDACETGRNLALGDRGEDDDVGEDGKAEDDVV